MGGWVGSRADLDAVVTRKIPSPRRESNPRAPIVQPVAQRYTTEISMEAKITKATDWFSCKSLAGLYYWRSHRHHIFNLHFDSNVDHRIF
jgi:hypothetical protein